MTDITLAFIEAAQAGITFAALQAEANGWMVVSWWAHSNMDPTKGTWVHDYRDDLGEALELYQAYDDGECHDVYPTALCACRNGVPFGKVQPYRLRGLLQEGQS